MVIRALTLVHDPASGRRDRIPGALIQAFADHRITHHSASFVDPDEIVPEIDGYDLLIVMGSDESAYDQSVPWLADELEFVAAVMDRKVPILGICFGAQLIARCLNGSVMASPHPERGFTMVESDDPDLIQPGQWMQLHYDTFTVPAVAIEIARNSSGPQAFIAGNCVGVQFHPEITTDSFESWVERWETAGAPANLSHADIDAFRLEIARYEQLSVRACGELVRTFCERYVTGFRG